jgi:hypothetical protein
MKRSTGSAQWTRRGAAAAGAAVVLGLTWVGGSASFASTAPAAAARPPSPAWHIAKQVRGGGFTAVTAVGKTGGWAFDGTARPTAWRRSGATWTQMPFPGENDEEVIAADATSATDVWAFTASQPGTRSRALRWNGSEWIAEKTFAQPIGGAVVLSARDLWVFPQQGWPANGKLAAWHYDGHAWSRITSGDGLEGGSGLSASDIWAFGGTDVAHWNGRGWSRTSVAKLLPARMQLNDPAVAGIDALSPDNVYAIGNGNDEDDGGPTVLLHYNGHAWTKVAQGLYGDGTQPRASAT